MLYHRVKPHSEPFVVGFLLPAAVSSFLFSFFFFEISVWRLKVNDLKFLKTGEKNVAIRLLQMLL